MPGKYRRRAAQMAHAATLPERQGLRQEKREANQTLRRGTRANRQGYNALDRTLEDIGNDYRKDYRGLTGGYTSGMAGFAPMLNVAAGGEGAVGAGAFGGVAASGMRGLAQQRSRGVEYTRSTRTQGAIEKKTNALNLLSSFEQTLRDIQQRRQGLNAQEGAMIPGLAMDMRAAAFDRRMQEEQLQMQRDELAQSQELAEWYAKYLRGQLGGGRDRNRGGGGGTSFGDMGGQGRAEIQHLITPRAERIGDQTASAVEQLRTLAEQQGVTLEQLIAALGGG